MTIVQLFSTAADFWSGMVEPDYKEYLQAPANLRGALHAAISLFHMSDWVFHTHETEVRSAFKYTDCKGNVQPVSNSTQFADALEQQNPHFGRIRGIANAAKHLNLKAPRPVPNAPSRAANIAVKALGLFGQVRFNQTPYNAGIKVMLTGPNGNDMEFSHVAKGAYDMWVSYKGVYVW